MALPGTRYTGSGMTYPMKQRASEVWSMLAKHKGVTLKYIWGFNPGAAGDHGKGLALDVMVFGNKAAGDYVASYLKTHAKRLNVQYIIWYQRIWNIDRASEGWRLMENRGSPTANHKDHVHVSFKPVAKTSYTPPSGYKPQTTTSPPATAKLTIDGSLGPATITKWQKVMGTTADGKISVPSSLVRKVQEKLKAKGVKGKDGKVLVVDGKGISSNATQKVGPTNTIFALQKYLGTTADGVLSKGSSSAVKALQRRLNEGKF